MLRQFARSRPVKALSLLLIAGVLLNATLIQFGDRCANTASNPDSDQKKGNDRKLRFYKEVHLHETGGDTRPSADDEYADFEELREELPIEKRLKQFAHAPIADLPAAIPTLSTENYTHGAEPSRQKAKGPYEETDKSALTAANKTNGFSFVKEMITTSNTTLHVYPWGKMLGCQDARWTKDLPSASVILTFFEKEKLSNVLHTVHSVLQRTPEHLLEEVIMVDDHSNKDDLQSVLEIYVKAVFPKKVKVIRSRKSLGLIRARLLGAKMATGDVIICLDSHMEVQDNWIEPLLDEIRQNRRTLASSYLDWMETKEGRYRWRYSHGPSTWKTYFEWTFVFGFQDMSIDDKARQLRDPTLPIKTPVICGTPFAINRKFFFEIGGFDEGMEGWGGENIDLALRTWLFGGRVVNVPCSHVAHYEEPGHRSYRDGWKPVILRNYKRVAEVWMDDYKPYVYYYLPSLKNIKAGNLTSRLALKKKAVHTFDYILSDVIPELGMPDRNTFAYGGLMQNTSLGMVCMYAVPLQSPTMSQCKPFLPPNMAFFWNTLGELRFPIHIFNSLRQGLTNTFSVRTAEYVTQYKSAFNTQWVHWKGGPLIDWRNGLCLQTTESYTLEMTECDFDKPEQQFQFARYNTEYNTLARKLVPDRGRTMYERTISRVVRYAHLGQIEKILHMMEMIR